MVKQKYFQNSFQKILAGLILILTFFSFHTTAFASSYNTSFSFDTTLKGITRSFDSQNIAFEASSATSIPWRHTVKTTYYITLYRDNGWQGKEKIGEVTLNRDSWGKAEWSNAGPGNYFIYLSKIFDGIELAG